VAIQRELAGRVRLAAPRQRPRTVAGLDAAFSRDGAHCIAGAVLWDLEERRVLWEHTARRKLNFPYVPGLLSFREAPAILAVLRKLPAAPDALMFDGQGLAHPRRFGLACHVGVLVDLPSVGCAKSRLLGEHREPGVRRGSRAALKDGDEIIGTVLRTRDGVRPVFVSVGHRMDLPAAESLVLAGAIGYRLPEPTRRADHLVALAKHHPR
jgi:deoxyribonuclease V